MTGDAVSFRPGPGYRDRPWLASYPPGVPADPDIPAVPLTRLLDDAAAAFPTRPALAFLGSTLSYAELVEQVDRLAGALAALGVRKGDRVALALPNCPQNVIGFYATLRLGAIVVEHNPLYSEPEMAHQLADCGARVLICLDQTYAVVAAARPHTALEEVVVTSIADYLPTKTRLALGLSRAVPVPWLRRRRAEVIADLPRHAPVRRFRDLLRPAPGRGALGRGALGRRIDAGIEPEIDAGRDLAVLQYTGGTTGRAKGAMLTHRNLVANAYQCRLWFPEATGGREVTLGVLPLFHAYGLTLCMTTTMLLAGTLVLLPRFHLGLLFRAVDEWRPTLFPGVPPMYQAIVDSPQVRKHDLRSIRACLSGAMRLPVETQERFEELTGGRLVEGYGLTEASPVACANPVVGTRKIGSIGVPLPGTAATVVDPDEPAREIEPGRPGELAIAGPQVFGGYWNSDTDAEPGRLFTGDGYLLTGDIAVMDPDGFFTVVDRKKELIIASGFNIYPSEVEDVLLSHPAIKDAAVIGVPEPYRGETVKAFVVPRPGATLTAEEVKAYAAQSLTAYKVPTVVEFRAELPHSTIGKVLRRRLRDEELRTIAETAP